jgi:hypothetical protein
LCLLGAWAKVDAQPGERLGLAAATGLFTVAATVSLADLGQGDYGVWPGLVIGGVLLALATLVDGRQIFNLAQSSWRELAAAAAGVLFLGSLFLPWQRWCYGTSSDFGPIAGRCLSRNGWSITVEAAAGLLAVVLLVAVLEPRRLRLSVVDLAATFGILVVTLGVALREESGPGFHVERGYGEFIGFVAAALLIALALMRSRPPTFDWHRLPVRAVPIAACAGYLVILMLPWWGIVAPDSSLLFALFSWPTIAGVLLGIRLLRLWARQVAGSSQTAELALLPIALLAVAAIDLIAHRERIMWVDGAVVGLCLLLALLGRLEHRGGIENFRIPQVLRVDRL